ncbi:recombinase family protein [Rhodocytophaga aerolata]|uniref:Recombinase family protein n=1 Tax=Rhodocytophaga aerolata TaxID=455078 RepID=A0ABT8REL8_9BACT|nr:recombinase family protein [Rhodocytophaga aerolata]MDO1449185.1 recombinase family protein [Rhodocytophaga aerolata]
MKIGYARVSTQDQNLELQLDALKAAGCEQIYKEKVSAASTDRLQLQKMMDSLRNGDTVVVWKLDRLGRSLKELIERVTNFQQKGIGFISLNDSIDTTTPQGRLVFNIFASLAEFEREIIRERTKAGLAAAKARGRQGGRPKGLSKEAISKVHAAKALFERKEKSAIEIAKILGIGRATLYRYLNYIE